MNKVSARKWKILRCKSLIARFGVFEIYIVRFMVQKFAAFMTSKGSLPCLQKPSIYPILSQFNPVHTSTPYSSNIHFNIISCTPRSPKVR